MSACTEAARRKIAELEAYGEERVLRELLASLIDEIDKLRAELRELTNPYD